MRLTKTFTAGLAAAITTFSATAALAQQTLEIKRAPVAGGKGFQPPATSIAEEPDTQVTLSYRSDGFSRAKAKNRDRVDALHHAGRLRVLLSSTVKDISPRHVTIDHEGTVTSHDNNAVIICAGGILPTAFLTGIGIDVETKHGTA